MNLKPRYETEYICSQIDKVVGRRYNIRPDLKEDEAPELSGYMYKETAAGLFRAWVLNELNIGILSIVNELKVADKEMILKRTGMEEDEFKLMLYRCVAYGILCENNIKFKNGNVLQLYLVDTGGIFALEDAGKAYSKIPFTISIDERISIYRKNIFYVDNMLINNDSVNVKFLENMVGNVAVELNKKSIILFDTGIAETLKIEKTVEEVLFKLKENSTVRLYDLSKRKFINL